MSLVEGKGVGVSRKIATFHIMRIKVAISSINSDKTRLELDSHADTTVIGKCCLVVHYFDTPVNVTGYDPEDGSKVFLNVKVVLDYDHPHTGKPYLLVINQAIHLDHLGHHLMCKMQCRTNMININETPKDHNKAPYESSYALQVEDPSDK